MAVTPFLSANGYLGLIAEATRGTTPASGTPFFFPTIQPKITPNLTWLNDPGLRGSPVENYDQIPATRSDDVDFRCDVYPDTFPILLCGVLGGNDAVTGVGPYSHVIGLYNSQANGSQPLSYSICLLDGANWYIVTGSQADQLDLTFGASVATEATMKYKGNPWTAPTTSAPTLFASPSFSAETLAPGWDSVITIASTQYTWIEEGSLTIARKTAPIFTDGQQAPITVFAGTCEVTGKFTAVVPSNSEAWSTSSSPTALTRDQQLMTMVLSSPNSLSSAVVDSITFTMTKAQFEKPVRSQGKMYTDIEVEFTAVANATDAISGWSPVKTTTSNGISTAYQTGH
jgi:hypothetical protein